MRDLQSVRRRNYSVATEDDELLFHGCVIILLRVLRAQGLRGFGCRLGDFLLFQSIRL